MKGDWMYKTKRDWRCICIGLLLCIISGITIICDLRNAEEMMEYLASVYMPREVLDQKLQKVYNIDYKFPMTYHEISTLAGAIWGVFMLCFGVFVKNPEYSEPNS